MPILEPPLIMRVHSVGGVRGYDRCRCVVRDEGLTLGRTIRSFRVRASSKSVIDRVVKELEWSRQGETTRTGNTVTFTFHSEPSESDWGWWDLQEGGLLSGLLSKRDDNRKFEVVAVDRNAGICQVTISGRIMREEADALVAALESAFPTS